MNTRYTAQTQRLIDAVLTSPGETDPTLRRVVEEQAAQLSGRFSRQPARVPSEVVGYINNVALHAYRTTDQDIEALRTAGYSEDAIFEITLSAASARCRPGTSGVRTGGPERRQGCGSRRLSM